MILFSSHFFVTSRSYSEYKKASLEIGKCWAGEKYESRAGSYGYLVCMLHRMWDDGC